MSAVIRALSLCVLLCALASATWAGAETEAPAAAAAASAAPTRASAVPIPDGQIDCALDKLDGLAAEAMARSGIPGMAIAVVHGGKTVYAKGFGVRKAGVPELVDADTVFQLASLSKPVGATVIASQVGLGRVRWDTPVTVHLPWFALADPYVTDKVTIGDLYAHRSGLPDHAGDKLEDLGYDRNEVLERLRMVPLAPFRSTYAYTNFGVTAAAEAVAAAAGVDWETLSEQALYQPLGMDSTSSRFAEYRTRANRAVGHVRENGVDLPAPERDADAQSPAGGVSSSANDMAKWLAMLLGNGVYDGRRMVEPAALLPAITPQIVSQPAGSADARAGFYGYGFNVGTSASGRVVLSHSGAFALGAASTFIVIPSADVAIVVLTNSAPSGVPETVAAQFSDLVQFGEIQQDWAKLYAQAFAPLLAPQGSLVGAAKPESPQPAQPYAAYTGIYHNDFYGALLVVDNAGTLEMRLGPNKMAVPLAHWSGDTFVFHLENENAAPGTISKADFSADKVTLEYYNEEGLGTFVRQ